MSLDRYSDHNWENLTVLSWFTYKLLLQSGLINSWLATFNWRIFYSPSSFGRAPSRKPLWGELPELMHESQWDDESCFVVKQRNVFIEPQNDNCKNFSFIFNQDKTTKIRVWLIATKRYLNFGNTSQKYILKLVHPKVRMFWHFDAKALLYQNAFIELKALYSIKRYF